MQKLFLASVAAHSIEKFIYFLKINPADKTIAFIPTASNIYQDWKPIEDRKKLEELGFKIKNIDLENQKKSDLLKKMKNIDLIFVAGGNSFYLLQEIKKSKFDEILKELINKGIPYIGSSAGTIITGPSIELATNIDDQNQAPELKSYQALNLVDFVALPHYDDPEFKLKIDSNLKKFKNYKHPLIKITDQQAILVNGSQIKIV